MMIARCYRSMLPGFRRRKIPQSRGKQKLNEGVAFFLRYLFPQTDIRMDLNPQTPPRDGSCRRFDRIVS